MIWCDIGLMCDEFWQINTIAVLAFILVLALILLESHRGRLAKLEKRVDEFERR